MTQNPWGEGQTQFFYEITPEKVLAAVESVGLVCTGRCFQLNSMENRVYEVEIEWDGPPPKNPSDRYRVVKFYRPGRWIEAQIREEHEFLKQLEENEIPVVAPIRFPNGDTLQQKERIWFCLYPRVGGRAPDELAGEQLERVARLLARIHTAGASRQSKHRVQLTPENYGTKNLEFLEKSPQLPDRFRDSFLAVGREIVRRAEPLFLGVKHQRIHGDCHFGNLLWNSSGPYFLDFDDMVVGPPIQDIWMLTPGRDEEALEKRRKFIAAYDEMCSFNFETLKLVEPLRSLRMIHFAAWIGKRWDDPAFKRAFPQYDSDTYWSALIQDLKEQCTYF